MRALRAHLEATDLEGSVKGWAPAARELVFPNTVGQITRYGGFLEGVWQPLLAAAKLPYRKPHAMRHSYATWMLEAGADLRWVRDQLGHSSIEETEGTYGHLERERHEGRVDLDAVLGGVQLRPPASTVLDAGGQLRDFPLENLVVEGKGFVGLTLRFLEYLANTDLQNAAERGACCHPVPQVSTISHGVRGNLRRYPPEAGTDRRAGPSYIPRPVLPRSQDRPSVTHSPNRFPTPQK